MSESVQVEANTIPTAGVIVFRGEQVLLVKHLAGAGHLTNWYGIPSGRIEQDESAQRTAVRELYEETGLQLSEQDIHLFPNNQFTAPIPRKTGQTQVFHWQVYFADITNQLSASNQLNPRPKNNETSSEWVNISQISPLQLLPNTLTALLRARLYAVHHPVLSLIVAIGQNRVIGKDNQLLWQLPSDLKRFKQLTVEHPIIMGRKTYQSIGKLLPNRSNIIVTRDKNFAIEGAVIAHSLEEAIEIARRIDQTEIFVIGGGELYHQAIDKADKLYITEVAIDIEGDAYFPDYNEFNYGIFTKEVNEDKIPYIFKELTKKDKLKLA